MTRRGIDTTNTFKRKRRLITILVRVKSKINKSVMNEANTMRGANCISPISLLKAKRMAYLRGRRPQQHHEERTTLMPNAEGRSKAKPPTGSKRLVKLVRLVTHTLQIVHYKDQTKLVVYLENCELQTSGCLCVERSKLFANRRRLGEM